MIELNDTVVLARSEPFKKRDPMLYLSAGPALRNDVPDTSGEALTRAGHAVSEGRLLMRGLPVQERAPDAPLYFFLRTLGAGLEKMEADIALAHAAIDARVVPQDDPAMGAWPLHTRVSELMGVLREAGEELRLTRAVMRRLAARLDMSPAQLMQRLAALSEGGDGQG